MKKLSIFGKIVFFLNSIFAVLLLLSYLLPYIPPSVFPALALLSLLLPILLIINVIFLVYWAIKGKRQFLLSALVLVLGVSHILALFRFGGTAQETPSDISVLSYNVLRFKHYPTAPQVNKGDEIHAFIYRENPDVVCLQEYHPLYALDNDLYPYTNRDTGYEGRLGGQIIFSKYPIVSTGILPFENTYNGGVYADIAFPKDTVRIYSLHFQSFRISSKFDDLQSEQPRRLVGKLGVAFEKQEQQMEKFVESESQSPHPVIVAGDFNNSATSYLYRKVKGDKNDAFAEAGQGTGATYTFDFVPLRIDFILADPVFEVLNFETYNKTWSDHKPIMSRFAMK